MPEKASREWNELGEGVILQSSHRESAFTRVEPTDERRSSVGEKISRRDYVNALALSNSGEAMIFERDKLDTGMLSWRVIGSYLKNGEDPMVAAQRTLLDETGYSSDEWLYLGSYVMADSDEHQTGVGHFFCARDAQQIARPQGNGPDGLKMKWVSQRDLKYALLDGRISVLSYAITISMALLTVLD
jgi:hypothetical protein